LHLYETDTTVAAPRRKLSSRNKYTDDDDDDDDVVRRVHHGHTRRLVDSDDDDDRENVPPPQPAAHRTSPVSSKVVRATLYWMFYPYCSVVFASGCWSTVPHAIVLTLMREHYYCVYLYMLCRLMY